VPRAGDAAPARARAPGGGGRRGHLPLAGVPGQESDGEERISRQRVHVGGSAAQPPVLGALRQPRGVGQRALAAPAGSAHQNGCRRCG